MLWAYERPRDRRSLAKAANQEREAKLGLASTNCRSPTGDTIRQHKAEPSHLAGIPKVSRWVGRGGGEYDVSGRSVAPPGALLAKRVLAVTG